MYTCIYNIYKSNENRNDCQLKKYQSKFLATKNSNWQKIYSAGAHNSYYS